MNSNFKIYNDLKNLSFELMTYYDNIPKKYYYLKDKLQESVFDSIKDVRSYMNNCNETSRIKTKYLKDLVMHLSMIDYYLECLDNRKVLGKDRLSKYCKSLEEIRKMVYGVIRSEKSKC